MTTQAREPEMGLTFEKVWAMFQETDKQIKEIAQRQKETDRQQKETDQQIKEIAQRQKETDRQQKETDRQIKETNKQIGSLGNRFGELAEH
ncbi:MAG: hypothetical protein LBU13_07150, partial [Synergistaceae bacterium]|nr:hypothetical protein [Synergistaceae bacterium]